MPNNIRISKSQINSYDLPLLPNSLSVNLVDFNNSSQNMIKKYWLNYYYFKTKKEVFPWFILLNYNNKLLELYNVIYLKNRELYVKSYIKLKPLF